MNHISMNRITWRSVFTKVPWIKAMLPYPFHFGDFEAEDLVGVFVQRSTSWLVSPRLFTSSILRSDSVVVPASEVVCATIVF
jgi:hypothetical protein